MIHLSEAAIAEFKRTQSKHPGASFRLGVAAGGCIEFYYTMAWDEVDSSKDPQGVALTDQIINCQGIQVTIAPQHQPYLNGLTLDYTEDLMGGGFRFHNPNAVNCCECGNSFAVSSSSPAVPKSSPAQEQLAFGQGNRLGLDELLSNG
ncbi:MAG: iron-sulfur cluster assembly accessory protein [Timaviella obliquedivisa GSE-PSE-MK23-08B]|nr:iron-sulfur cluster assembly accessory protein [Timaviella obliquedivisa GSE-PSE-MK23-08B]